MLNAERFKEEINKCNNEFGLTDSIADCKTLDCKNCRFSRLNNSDDEIILCCTRKVKWLLSEYKETIKLRKLEYRVLEHIQEYAKYRYIARDKSNNIYVYKNKPEKHVDYWSTPIKGKTSAMLMFCDCLFKFIQWEDKEPTSIQEVLNNCEVVEDD